MRTHGTALASHAALGRFGPPESFEDAYHRVTRYPMIYGSDGVRVLIDGEEVPGGDEEMTALPVIDRLL